jgi:Ca2+-binding RTX toxin-like protein
VQSTGGGLTLNAGAANNGSNDTLLGTLLGNPLHIFGGTGNDTFTFGTAGSLTGALDGGAGSNTLVGPNATNAWVVTATNAGTLNGSFTFQNIATLDGGSGNDSFKIKNAAIAGVNGGAGSNSLDYSAYSGGMGVNLQTHSASYVSSFTNIQTFIGSPATNNTLVGANVANVWALTGPSAGTLNAVTFSAFQYLVGGSNNDSFAIHNGDPITSIDGGAGSNTLDYSGYSGGMGVSLQSHSAGYVSTFTNIQNFIGSPAPNNTLVGANVANVWTLTGANAGTVNAVSFSNFQYLVGGSSSDSFVIQKGASATNINGGAGNNWLDYSAWTAGVTVNLTTGNATGLTSVSNVQNVIGGAGNDTLTGSAAGGILIGGAGTDTITAGAGRSILIGDGGNDQLTAGASGDILIGGTTAEDAPSVNESALLALLAEWQRTDIGYSQRITDLKNGTGLTQGNELVFGTTVLDDGGSNTLNGNAGASGNELDWFFANQAAGHDTINHLLNGEQVN